MNPLFTGVLAAGGVYVATSDEASGGAGGSKPRVPDPKPGTTRFSSWSFRSATYAPGTGVGDIPNLSAVMSSPLIRAQNTSSPNGLSAEAELAIKDKLRAEYEKLSGEAKRAACERLKDQFPDDSNVQALNCADATFQQVLNVVGAAIGTAVCGPACGALGVIAAQYFGEDINELWNDYVAGVWSAPADHTTETLSLAQACARGDAATKAYLKQQAISRGITPPKECG